MLFVLARLSDLDFLYRQNGGYVGCNHRCDVVGKIHSRSDVLRKELTFDISCKKGSLATTMTFSWEAKCAIKMLPNVPLISDSCQRQVSLRVRGGNSPVAKQV